MGFIYIYFFTFYIFWCLLNLIFSHQESFKVFITSNSIKVPPWTNRCIGMLCQLHTDYIDMENSDKMNRLIHGKQTTLTKRVEGIPEKRKKFWWIALALTKWGWRKRSQDEKHGNAMVDSFISSLMLEIGFLLLNIWLVNKSLDCWFHHSLVKPLERIYLGL